MKSISLLFILLGFSVALHAQQRIYVSQNANGANTGTSWVNAFTDLQTALAAAQAGDEIWIAEGTYKPTTDNNRSASFQPRSGVALYGGFAGTETNLSQRNWTQHPVLLSGDIGTPGDSTDNAYNIMYLEEPDSFTVLDGLYFSYGLANGPAATSQARERSGSALYVWAEGLGAEAFPEIRNCVFEYNTAQNFGGAIMFNGRNYGAMAPRLKNCRFERNRSLFRGGAIARYGNGLVERGGKDIENCIFQANTCTQRAGAIFFTNAFGPDDFIISGCRFEDNEAVVNEGIMQLNPGSFNITFEDIEILDNRSGGTLIGTSSIDIVSIDRIKFDNCRLKNISSPLDKVVVISSYETKRFELYNTTIDSCGQSSPISCFEVEANSILLSNSTFSNSFIRNIIIFSILKFEANNIDLQQNRGVTAVQLLVTADSCFLNNIVVKKNQSDDNQDSKLLSTIGKYTLITNSMVVNNTLGDASNPDPLEKNRVYIYNSIFDYKGIFQIYKYDMPNSFTIFNSSYLDTW